jgi:DNA-binding response OmpR family regulator
LRVPHRILLLDDEAGFREAIAEYLETAGYLVDQLEAPWQLDEALSRKPPAALLLLDLGLPGEDGRSVLMRLRAASDLPVILISGRIDTVDAVIALELGADDVVAKPVEPRELVARIEAVLRRGAASRRGKLRFESATADLGHARLLHDDGRIERLSAGEVALLRVLAAEPGVALSRDMLIEQAPGDDEDAMERAIDNRVNRLRAKLGTTMLRTVRGVGYAFDPQASKA